MKPNNSKLLKAILYPNNLAEMADGVMQSQCFTLQDYHYHCYRERDGRGNPFGGMRSGYLEFSVIVNESDACKYLYQCMALNENVPFSFIFNATFGERGRLADFEDGLITYGYVTDIDESCYNGDDTGEEQLLLHVKVLLSNLLFLGFDTVHSLEITKD